MTLLTIPGKAVDGALRLIRLPADLVLSIVPESRAATSAGLMIDRADAAVRRQAGRVLSDSEMREDASQRRVAADERRRAFRLRTEADARLETAEAATEQRRDEAKARRKKANEQAKRRQARAKDQREQKKAQAAKAANDRKVAARTDAAKVEEKVETRGKLDRLEQLEKRSKALEVKESAVRAAAEARRLEEAAATAKGRRKANSN